MRTIRIGLLVMVAACCEAGVGWAQEMFDGPGRNPGASLAEILGKDKSFSAIAHITVSSFQGTRTRESLTESNAISIAQGIVS